MRHRSLLSLAMLTCCTLASAAPSNLPSGRIDLSISRVTLAQALSELGDKAEIPLACRSGELEKRPFQLFIRRQTLGETMKQIAAFVPVRPGSASWERGSIDNRPGYRLHEDLRSQQERTTQREQLRKQREQRLVKEINTALKMAELKPEQLRALRSQNPELVHWMPALRPSLRILNTLPLEQRNQILTGKSVTLAYRDLSPVQQSLVQVIVGDRKTRTTIPIEGRNDVVFEWNSRKDLPQCTVTIRQTGSAERPGISVFIPTLPGDGIGWPDVLHPPALAEKEQPEWMREAVKPRQEEQRKQKRAVLVLSRKDPDLRQKLTLKAMVEVTGKDGKKIRRYSDLSMVLEQIADKTGLSVIGDYDPCWDDFYSWNDPNRPGQRISTVLMQDLKDVELWEALEYCRERFDIRWEKHAKFLWVRSPRVPYALADGIDLLDQRPAPLPKAIQELLKEAED